MLKHEKTRDILAVAFTWVATCHTLVCLRIMFPTLHPHSLVGYITILWFFKAPFAILKFILSPEIFIETKFLCKPFNPPNFASKLPAPTIPISAAPPARVSPSSPAAAARAGPPLPVAASRAWSTQRRPRAADRGAAGRNLRLERTGDNWGYIYIYIYTYMLLKGHLLPWTFK